MSANAAVVSVVNPKGGTGKTTTVLILAEQLAEQGNKVAVFDMDPNQFLWSWESNRRNDNRKTPFTIFPLPKNSATSGLPEMVRENVNRFDYIIIDLEGTASLLTSRAISRSHLVIVPFRMSAMDADMAAKAFQLVYDEQEPLERVIPVRALFTAVNHGFATAAHNTIAADLETAGIPRFNRAIRQGKPMNDLFMFNLTLAEQLGELAPLKRNEVPKVNRAIEDAAALAGEVIEIFDNYTEAVAKAKDALSVHAGGENHD